MKNRLRRFAFVAPFTFLACLSFLLYAQADGEEEWVLYSASNEAEDTGTFKDWYGLNCYAPSLKETASTLHFFDPESVAPNSPSPGSITRVWERSVTQKETKSYVDTRLEIEKEEEKKLNRKITPLDSAWILPLAIKRATHETRTLFEINCGAREFIITEVSHYDKDENRMTREINMNPELWISIEPNTVMEELMKKICN